jgi:GNAT superfamily N-acetyltransferase
MTKPSTPQHRVPFVSSPIMRATPRDLDQVTSVLTQAFMLGDFAPWLIAGIEERATRYTGYFRVFARAFLTSYIVEVTPDRVGVALWARLPAGHKVEIPGYEQAMAIGLGEHLPRFQALDTAMDITHPTERDHDYLALLAVRPDHHHRGTGSALLAHHLAALDREGRPAYLEATGLRTRALYLRHGFTDLCAPVEIGPNGPWLRPMWREARGI